MELKQLICPACIGTVDVPADAKRVVCSYCGSELFVEHNQGFTNLSLAETIKETLQDVGQETQSAIRDNTGVTKAELQRLQIGQQISTLQIQLSSIRAEIRSLEREKKPPRFVKKQLKDLRTEEQECLAQIRNLQSVLAADTQTRKPKEEQRKRSSQPKPMPAPLRKSCIGGCLTYFLVAVVLGLIGIPDVGLFLGFIISIIVFVYLLFRYHGREAAAEAANQQAPN